LDKIYKLTTPSYLSAYWGDIYLDNLSYDEIRITSLEGTVYLKMKVSDYISKHGVFLSKYIESELYEDGTVLVDFSYDPNKHYYIELYDSILDDNIVVTDF
jgi:hypothetical protein